MRTVPIDERPRGPAGAITVGESAGYLTVTRARR